MTIQPWLASAIVAGVGAMALFSYRYILRLIDNNKIEYDKDIAETKLIAEKATKDAKDAAEKSTNIISGELKELRAELHSRVSSSEDKLSNAIRDLTQVVVPRSHCDSKQEWWGQKFDNLVDTLNTAAETRIKADAVRDASIEDTLLELINGMKSLENKFNGGS